MLHYQQVDFLSTCLYFMREICFSMTSRKKSSFRLNLIATAPHKNIPCFYDYINNTDSWASGGLMKVKGKVKSKWKDVIRGFRKKIVMMTFSFSSETNDNSLLVVKLENTKVN